MCVFFQKAWCPFWVAQSSLLCCFPVASNFSVLMPSASEYSLLKLSFLPCWCGSLICSYLYRYLFEVGGKEITDASRQLLEWEATELQVRICCQGAMTVLTVTLFSVTCVDLISRLVYITLQPSQSVHIIRWGGLVYNKKFMLEYIFLINHNTIKLFLGLHTFNEWKKQQHTS